MYDKLVIKSFKDIFNNWQVFLPDIVNLAFTLVFGIIFLYLFGLDGIFSLDINNQEELALFVVNYFSSISSWLGFLIGLSVFFVINFFIGTGFQVMRYGLITDLLNKKKLDFIGTFTKKNKEFYWKLIATKVLLFLILLIGFIALMAVIFLFSFNKVLAALIGVIAFFVIVIYLTIKLFFTIQILFMEKRTPVDAIKNSFEFSKGRTGTIILLALITFVGIFIASLIINIIANPILFSLVFVIFISSLLNIIPLLWRYYFIFLAYKELNGKRY